MTFADDIEQATGGEPIEAVVIGDMGWTVYGKDERHAPALAHKGELLTWDVARPLLDYVYDDGFGAPDCNAVYAWTATRVIYVVQYDGSTGIHWLPRNPTPTIPQMPGG